MTNLYLKKILKFNMFFILTIVLLFIISLTTIYSATINKAGSFFIKEIIWFVLAMIVYIVVALIDYTKYAKYSLHIYIFNIVMLLSVLVIGSKKLGARRWIDLGPIALQPSEFAKLLLIFSFSSFLINHYSDRYVGFKAMFHSFLHIFPIFFLIVIEPDLGTSLVIILIYGVLLFINKLEWKCIASIFLSAMFLIPFAYKFLLKEYQKDRVDTFLNPELDALGTGWNITQSKIAIGSGQIFGKGFLNNTQGKLKFLPESHTDLAQIVYIADTTEDKFGKYICYGIATIFFFHIFVNMGMIMGIMPVTGLPLLLMSYGGSSLVFSFLMLGIVQSVKLHRGSAK